MKRIIIILLTAFLYAGCDFLDVQPEQKGTLEEAFANQNTAENFLYSCYSFMPATSDFNGEPQTLGASDEVCLTSQWATNWHYSKIVNIGAQTAADPIYNYWSYYTSQTQPTRCKAYNLYGAIRQCYTFLDKVRTVPGISTEKLNLWIPEAQFLIAYYHYLLLRLYGPIVIVEKEIPFDAPEDLYYPKRKPYDECVSWISDRLDEVALKLPAARPSYEMGRPTSVVAKAIKSRMLLYAASPLFNGNSEFYADFKNKSGENLISLQYDKEKWKKALDATEAAIDAAHSAGHSLFEYPSSPSGASDQTKAYYNHRYMVVMMPSEGNTDMIWAYSKDQSNIQQMIAARGLAAGSTSVPYGGIAPSFQMVETFLTKNGLPMSVDPTFDYAGRYDFAKIPGSSEWTVKMHLNREPRFYADIAYDRATNYELNGKDGISAPGYTLYLRMGEKNPATGLPNANDPLKDMWTVNGYLTKKFLHPSSNFENNLLTKRKPTAFPLIRLTELYLNYAEAYYEYYGRLDGQALTYFNEIRRRAGIPDVDVSWQGIPGKDYREIIRQERTIELMFEGHRFFDARRWKIAHLTFSKVQKRWNCFASGYSNQNVQPYDDYLVLRNSAEPTKTFVSPKHYLYPLGSRDIDINYNLVQNPGW